MGNPFEKAIYVGPTIFRAPFDAHDVRSHTEISPWRARDVVVLRMPSDLQIREYSGVYSLKATISPRSICPDYKSL